MAFKMKGWAPKGPLTYKGGGKAASMPTTNPAFKIEDPNTSVDSSNFYENLNDDANITGMKVSEGQQTVSLNHNDIHSLKAALQKGGLDKSTRDAYMAAINEGVGNEMVIDPKSGEMNFQTNTGSIVTRPGSSSAMNNLLTTLDQSRGRRKNREEEMNQPTRLETIKPSKLETQYDSKNYVPNFPKPTMDNKKVVRDDRNIEGNKGGKTLSQKRAAAVNQKKLSSYGKAWESNKGGVQSKYKNKAEFVKAAEDWWAKKGLDK